MRFTMPRMSELLRSNVDGNRNEGYTDQDCRVDEELLRKEEFRKQETDGKGENDDVQYHLLLLL